MEGNLTYAYGCLNEEPTLPYNFQPIMLHK